MSVNIMFELIVLALDIYGYTRKVNTLFILFTTIITIGNRKVSRSRHTVHYGLGDSSPD